MPYKSLDEINEKIREGKAVVVTADEIKDIVEEKGPKGRRGKLMWLLPTFGPMCSSGVFHSGTAAPDKDEQGVA